MAFDRLNNVSATETWHSKGIKMQKKVFLSTLAVSVILAAAGCSSGDPAVSTPAEKKAFAGGPMPADARAKFEAAQKQGAIAREAAIEKAKAAAMAGGK